MLLVAILACDEEEDPEGVGPPLGDGSGESCDDHAPVIGEFVVEEGKPVTPEGSTTQYPSVDFRWEMTDEDLDLNVFSYRLWIELADDGVADTAREPLVEGEYELDDGECSSGAGGFTQGYGVTDNTPAYSTAYDATLIVADMHGTDSEPAHATFTTPGPLQ